MIQKRMELLCVGKNERPGKGDGADQRFYYNGTFAGFGFTWDQMDLTQEQFNKFQPGATYDVDVSLIPSVAQFPGRYRPEAVYKIQLGQIREKSPAPGPDPRQERTAAPPSDGQRRPVSAGQQ